MQEDAKRDSSAAIANLASVVMIVVFFMLSLTGYLSAWLGILIDVEIDFKITETNSV